jgi:DNA-binding CsgD family transcriptional regulator
VNDLSDNQINQQFDSVDQTSSAIKKALEQVSIQFSKVIPEITLSPREKECLKHIISGKTAKLCANAMNLSYRTVESYISHIKDKLGVNTRSDLIALAIKLRLMD